MSEIIAKEAAIIIQRKKFLLLKKRLVLSYEFKYNAIMLILLPQLLVKWFLVIA